MVQKKLKARSSVSFKWPGKMKEKYDGKRVCENGMESNTAGLETDNACVFIVHPVGDFKEDVFQFLDTSGLQTSNADTNSTLEADIECKLGILFREAKYLKKSMRGCIGDELSEFPTVYLLLFRDI